MTRDRPAGGNGVERTPRKKPSAPVKVVQGTHIGASQPIQAFSAECKILRSGDFVLANFRPLPQIVPDWQGLYIQEDCLFILVLFVRRCSMLGLLYLFVYNKVFVL